MTSTGDECGFDGDEGLEELRAKCATLEVLFTALMEPFDPNQNPQLDPANAQPEPYLATPEAGGVVVGLAGPSTASPVETAPVATAVPTTGLEAPAAVAAVPEAATETGATAGQVTGSTGAPPRSKKKPLLLIVGILLVILLLAGGFLAWRMLGGSKALTEPVTLTYWGLWDSPQIMQPLIEEYQQQNKQVTIAYEQRPVANHYTTVKSRIQSGGAANNAMPDIVRLHSSWVPVLRNYLAPLPKAVMSASDFEANQYPVTKDTLLAGGNYYAMALSTDGLALVYNRNLFNEAGITSVPTTWDEVRQAAAQITKVTDKGAIRVGGIAMGSAHNVDHFAEIIGLLMAQNGVETINEAGEVAFAKAMTADGHNLGAEVLAFYTLFATSEKVWDEGMESSSVAFSKGNVGMVLVPSWRIAGLIEQNPQLSLGVTTAPQLVSDRQVGYASYWVEAVPKASPHQTEAWKFISWLARPEQQTKLHQSVTQVRTLAQPPANPQSASLVAYDELIAPYVTQAAGYRSSLWGNNTGAEELNEAINQALAEAVTATAKAGSDREGAAAKALEAAAAKVSELLAEQR